MALPPEPIAGVLDQIRTVVEAEVEAVEQGEDDAAFAIAPPGFTGAAPVQASQTVRLKVLKVHFGEPGLRTVVADKPPAGYVLRPGSRGPFVLDGSRPIPTILGRYWPDTWPLSAILDTLASKRT